MPEEKHVFSADVSLNCVSGLWCPSASGNGTTTAGSQLLSEGVEAAVNVIRLFLGVIAIIWILWNGMQMTLSGGNEEQVKAGKQAITWALLGLVLSLTLDSIIFGILDLKNFQTAEGVVNAGENATILILDALSWFQSLVIMAAVAFLLVSGWNMISAFGDTKKKNKSAEGGFHLGWSRNSRYSSQHRHCARNRVSVCSSRRRDYSIQPQCRTWYSGNYGYFTILPWILAIIALAVLVYGGGLWISAFGDEERVETGKKP